MEVRVRAFEAMNLEQSRLRSPAFEWIFAATLFAVGFGYSIYTKHVWEDYFITFRHSKNLAEGRGLVFEEGERIHGFTSPIGVLLPAAFHRLAGNPVDFEPALWMFRVVGALAYAAAGFLIVRILRSAAPDQPLVPWAAALLFAVEFKSLAFSMNGMETGLMLFFLAWIVRLVQRGADVHWKALGVVWAGLQWTRPDGCIFIAATAVSALALGVGGPRGGLLKGFVKAGILSLLLYSPWLVGTTLYYGTPIPHTVMAKSGTQPPIQTLFGPFPTGLVDRMRDRAGAVFEPIYAVFGGWPETLVRFSRGVGIAGMVWWLIPFSGPFARFSRWTGLSAFLGVMYLAFVMLFPWYLPPIALLMILSLTAGAFTAPRTFILVVIAGWLFVEMWDKNYFVRMDDGRLPFKPKEAWIFAGAALAAFALPKLLGRSKASLAAVLGVCAMLGAVAACSWKNIAVQQEYVETRHRRAIGEWLKANSRPGETIFLESLGYIGYFSEGRMLDWPGLVSPRVVAARKKIRGHMIDHLPLLEPDWLVLRREHEYEYSEKNPYVKANYKVAKEFSVVDDLRRDHPDLPGLGYPLHDADYVVMRRR
jgi:hypothetical protein